MASGGVALRSCPAIVQPPVADSTNTATGNAIHPSLRMIISFSANEARP
jgi:hypothetical protein